MCYKITINKKDFFKNKLKKKSIKNYAKTFFFDELLSKFEAKLFCAQFVLKPV